MPRSPPILEPTGRPPFTCESINSNTFNSKYSESRDSQRKKKCKEREYHTHYPCDAIYDDNHVYKSCKTSLIKYNKIPIVYRNRQPRIVYLRPYSIELYQQITTSGSGIEGMLLFPIIKSFEILYGTKIKIDTINPQSVCGPEQVAERIEERVRRADYVDTDYRNEYMFSSLEFICPSLKNVLNDISKITQKEIWDTLHMIAVQQDTLMCVWYKDEWIYIYPRKGFVENVVEQYSVSLENPIIIMYAIVNNKKEVTQFISLKPNDEYFSTILKQFEMEKSHIVQLIPQRRDEYELFHAQGPSIHTQNKSNMDTDTEYGSSRSENSDNTKQTRHSLRPYSERQAELSSENQAQMNNNNSEASWATRIFSGLFARSSEGDDIISSPHNNNLTNRSTSSVSKKPKKVVTEIIQNNSSPTRLSSTRSSPTRLSSTRSSPTRLSSTRSSPTRSSSTRSSPINSISLRKQHERDAIQPKTKTKCFGNNNPGPPCEEGYHPDVRNSKNEECCYKDKNSGSKKSTVNNPATPVRKSERLKSKK
jgi:hypothetical protein